MSFPEELRKLNRWVCYRLDPDPKGEKPRKTPVNARTGKNASSTNADTWSDYETAKEAAEKYGYAGIGFVIIPEDGIVGIDVDHCLNRETGEWSETAKDIMSRQNTYMEYSPSGDGLHVWLRGKKPGNACKNTETGVEMYEKARYLTVTERAVEGCADTVVPAAEGVLQGIYDKYIAKQKPERKKRKKAAGDKLTDEEILEKAKEASNGEAFTALWEGRWQGEYPSQSEADMALCMKLAFWTAKDKEQMDRLFRQSGLMREKWDQPHHASGATYGQETIERAAESTDFVYTSGGGDPIFEYEGKYFRAKGDSMYPITNFTVQPLDMLITEDETQMTADLITCTGESYRMTFMTSDFSCGQKFKALLTRKTIALAFFGGEGDLELLKVFVSRLEWNIKTGVKAMGIHEHEDRPVYVTAEGGIEAGGAAVEDIVQMEKYMSLQSGIHKAQMLTPEKLKEAGTWILGYNEPEKTISILAWAAGCFLKPMLRKEGIKFPHLFLIGEAGSGKSTTLEKILLPVFSTNRVLAATQMTPFTLMKDAASSNLVPMPLDEFKPSKMDRLRINALYNHFRDTYDCHDGQRGRSDLSKVIYQLLAPLIVAGEESPDEAAIRERSIELLFSKKDLKRPEHRDAFRRAEANAVTLQELGRTMLDTALRLTSTQAAAWHEEGIGQFSGELPSRVISNLACCFAGLKLLETLCAGMGMNWDDVFPISFAACIRYLEHGAKEYLLDGGTHNLSIVEQTFEIMSRMGPDTQGEYQLSDDKTQLFIRLPQMYDKYTKYRKDYAIIGEVLPYAQFRKQLQHSDLFIQQNYQRRINGNNTKCWVVNYQALKERCDVSGFEPEGIPPLK